MTHAQKLDHLLNVLYETVLEPVRLNEAVELCFRYAGGVDGHISTFTKNFHPKSMVSGTTGIWVDFQVNSADYFSHYSSVDPRLKLLREKALHEWSCCHHYFEQKFVDHNEFYQDCYLSQGLRYAMSALINNEEGHSYLVVQRAIGQQPFSPANQLAAQRFSGHLQRVLRLQKHTENLHAKVELGATAIDSLSFSMLMVDGKGVILHLNADAEGLLNNPVSGLTATAGRLSGTNPASKNRLASLITGATGYPALGGAMFLNRERTLQVFIIPLPAASHLVIDWQIPLALVCVMSVDKKLSALELIGQLYDLSPKEKLIASVLLSGRSLDQYALQNSVSMHTVRSHLKNLFEKTGTHSQLELVALLSRITPIIN